MMNHEYNITNRDELLWELQNCLKSFDTYPTCDLNVVIQFDDNHNEIGESSKLPFTTFFDYIVNDTYNIYDPHGEGFDYDLRHIESIHLDIS